MPRHIIIKLLKTKDKEKILKAVRESHTLHPGEAHQRITRNSRTSLRCHGSMVPT